MLLGTVTKEVSSGKGQRRREVKGARGEGQAGAALARTPCTLAGEPQAGLWPHGGSVFRPRLVLGRSKNKTNTTVLFLKTALAPSPRGEE